ncbi:MAG: hypothetical protein ACTSYA_11600, partial [Candidatus Kariarchaeaceae archaeon]
IAEVNTVIGELDKLGLILKQNDFRFIDVIQNQIDFNKMSIKSMPIGLKGIYDRNTKKFVKVEHSLLKSSNISVKVYLPTISELWLIDYLSGKGISVTKDNIFSTLPTDNVIIKGYPRGDKVLDFTYDVNSNRLLDISVKGSDTKIDSMTFEEFSLIKGIKAASEKEVVKVEVEEKSALEKLVGTCDNFAKMLETCNPYSCEYEHPFSGEDMTRRISGVINGKCRYIEEMPENQSMFCDYSDDLRAAVSEYYTDLLGVGIVVTSSTFGDGGISKTYTVAGQDIANPAQHAFTSGECSIVE